MILQSHPTGNANVRQTALALAEAELLAEFWTCLSWDPNAVAVRLLPEPVQKQLARRAFDPEIREVTHTLPWREIGRLLAPKVGWKALTRHETGVCSIDTVFRSLDRKVAGRLGKVEGLRGVYAGEDGARDTFQEAQKRDLKCFYDLPIGYWRSGAKILAEEREREPEWAETLTGTLDSPGKLARKDAELSMADVVFVASSFTKSTLELATQLRGNVCVVPYGSPLAVSSEDFEAQQRKTQKLRVLFVGSLGQRKGLSYLLRAVELVGNAIELTIVGRKTGGHCVPLESALKKHRWIESLSHSDILQEMRSHDVLVFPSLFEGFGLVILEAMSQGIPVIATPNTAGPDVITDGEDGFIVPIRSAEAIAEKITMLVQEPDLLSAMKFAAWKKSQLHLWSDYRQTQARVIRSEIS